MTAFSDRGINKPGRDSFSMRRTAWQRASKATTGDLISSQAVLEAAGRIQAGCGINQEWLSAPTRSHRVQISYVEPDCNLTGLFTKALPDLDTRWSRNSL